MIIKCIRYTLWFMLVLYFSYGIYRCLKAYNRENREKRRSKKIRKLYAKRRELIIEFKFWQFSIDAVNIEKIETKLENLGEKIEHTFYDLAVTRRDK